MSRSSKGKKYFDLEKYRISRLNKKRGTSVQIFGGGDAANLQDYHISQDGRRFKTVTTNLELQADRTLAQLEDETMGTDFSSSSFDSIPVQHVVDKPPRKRYFVSVSSALSLL